ncbi:hypothetical protein EV426DRAFT_699264 [Tirmania nivea]|nr:hypothetical protein EV426DRAFT_699264 [Tirmania nivea]
MVDTTRSALDIAEGDLSVPTGSSPATAPDNKNSGIDYTRSKYSEMETRGRKQDYEEYDEEDARAMSPRRSIAELEQIGSEAKALLEEQAKALQSGLLALLERVDKVKEEHEKLEAENQFLQEYIGSLMATSKITGPGPSGNRNSRSGMGRVK